MIDKVLPMYMGVILVGSIDWPLALSAPHVYGGDPGVRVVSLLTLWCSPCIWG